MDRWVRILRPFNNISVISGRWKGEDNSLRVMKQRLGSGRISPPAGLEPASPWVLNARPRERFNFIKIVDDFRNMGIKSVYHTREQFLQRTDEHVASDEVWSKLKEAKGVI